MKKTIALTTALLLVGVALPAVAGEKKCEEDAETCLKTMAEHLEGRGWVGIEMDQDEETGMLTVVKVIGGSPADEAGFQPDDVIVSFNGIAYADENKAALKEAYAALQPGKTVTYVVGRGDSETELQVDLVSLPKSVMAQWVGQHMLDYHLAKTPVEEEAVAADG